MYQVTLKLPSVVKLYLCFCLLLPQCHWNNVPPEDINCMVLLLVVVVDVVTLTCQTMHPLTAIIH